MAGDFASWRARSVFTKLLVVLIITGILINGVVFGFFAALFRNEQTRPFHKDLVNYIVLLAREVGDPPDLEKARAIAARSSFRIRYEGVDNSWATANTHLPLEQFSFKPSELDPGIKLGIYRGRHVVIVDREKGRLIFESEAQRRFFPELLKTHHIVILFLSLISVTLMAWLALSWILKPLRWLSTGVQQVADGNLAHKVPASRQDELGELSRAFNSMTARIRNMLASHEQLLLDVSHELRSPLTRMNVLLELLADSKTKESLRQDVREIEHLVTELLEAARLRAPNATLHRAEVDLADIIISTVRFHAHQRPGVKLMDLAGDLRCQADRDLLVIVIRNLITNALKYSEGSTRPVEISAYVEPDRVALRITDFGEGISAADLPHIFEPFYRADKSRARSTGGYGLGLSLCKAIIDAHNGELKVESGVGKGTTVTVLLPR